MFRIAVCDDDKSELELLGDYAVRYSMQHKTDVTVKGYLSGEELLENYKKGEFDLIILDVEMGEMNGILTADRIRHIPDHEVDIMYLSNFPQYMQASFGVRAAQYLTKPMTYEIFEKRIGEIMEYLSEEKEKIIEIVSEKEKHYIKEQEIISIEAVRGKLIIRTEQDELIARGKIKDYEQVCKKYMIAPNRSILINTRYIRSVRDNNIVLKTGREIAISRKRIVQVKEDISRNISERIF